MSSILLVGKVGAESLVAFQTQVMKPKLDMVVKVAKLIPVYCLTAVFRYSSEGCHTGSGKLASSGKLTHTPPLSHLLTMTPLPSIQ